MSGKSNAKHPSPTKERKLGADSNSPSHPPRGNSRSPDKRSSSPEKKSASTLSPAVSRSRSVSPSKKSDLKSSPSKGRSPSPVKGRPSQQTSSGALPKAIPTKPELHVYVFSNIANIVSCIQKSLDDDKFAENHNIVLIQVESDDISKMLEQAEILISEPKLIAPYLKQFKCLKWMQSTWAGVDAIFKQFKIDKEEYEQRLLEYNKFQNEMESQRLALDAQKQEVIAHLGGVDQALAQARAQLRAMTKQHLEELRSMNNPPAIVKFCLEAVAMLLVPAESHPMPWENIRKLTRKDDFIQSILDFDGITQTFPLGAIATIKSQYLSQPNFTQKNVEYASKACGPLMGWLDAQIQFGEVMSQNAPQIDALKELQKKYNELIKKCDSMQAPPELPVPSYTVTRMAGVFGVAMSEYVFGHILSLERDLPRLRQLQQESTWLPSGQYTYRSLTGRIIGIMGLGDIGSRIGFIARSFGMQVWGLVQDPSKHQTATSDSEQAKLFTPASINEFLTGCDYVVNTLPNTPYTTNLLSPYKQGVEPVCSLFKHATQQPIFINIGRGTIATEESILFALNSGWISHAVLDVFNQEPLSKESPLWKDPRVTITPHVSGITKDTDVAKVFKDNLKEYINGNPLKFVVDWTREY